MQIRKTTTMVCKSCKAKFQARSDDVARGFGLFCSRKCKNSGEHNPSFNNWSSRNNYAYKLVQKARCPERVKARQDVCDAIRRGELIRGNCSACGSEKAHAHHEDYSKPLDVIWLCRKHHTELHAAIKQSCRAHQF